MATTIMATRQVVEDYQRLFVNRRAYTMQSMRPHPGTGRHYYFRPSKKGTDIPAGDQEAAAKLVPLVYEELRLYIIPARRCGLLNAA